MGRKQHSGYQNRSQNGQQTQKMPQDHLQQEKSPKIFSTKSGFTYQITENMNDMRLLDALVTMQDPSLSETERSVACTKAIRFILGENQKEALFAHIVRRYGWARPDAVARELMEIIANFDESKKK